MSRSQNASSRAQVEILRSVKTFLDSKFLRSQSVETYKNYLSGLTCFNTFLVNRLQHNVETILPSLLKGEINVYEVPDSFVVNLVRGENVNKSSINVYLTIVKSYLGYHDIDIIPARFKKRVTVPQIYREDEEPLDVSDIRIILLACSNRRLKPYLLVLASGGMRAVEALAIRNRDINFSINPTKIHIRKEFAKTRVGRDIYISEEATQALKTWLRAIKHSC